MHPDPTSTTEAGPNQSQPADHTKVLAWLSSQATPDHGDETPPLPSDLLKALEKKFGAAPDTPLTAPAEKQGLLSMLAETLTRKLALVGGIAAACLAVLLAVRNTYPPDSGTATDPEIVLRGGNETKVGNQSGISWHWIGSGPFAAEQERLGKEGFVTEIAKAAVVITLDAESDPHFVLVSGTKSGIPKPEWSTRLPKLPADAQRPDLWLQALIQLQEKIDSTPP